jgi:amidophosphoribosyltransferase
MIAGYGLLAFRDPYGIRPLVIGRNDCEGRPEWLVASESVAIDVLGFTLLRDVAPGEAVLIDTAGRFHSRQCADHTVHAPCMFEFVYLARPDSIIDGVSVYDSRVKMGEFLAAKMKRTLPHVEVDVVIPIPDSSRPAAMEMANRLGLPYREGFVKNRYIGRTFIMPGQATRRKSVRQKLNTVRQEFTGKRVLLVDDSIVRGTTSREIVNMAREAGASAVYLASAAPPVRYANVYGIDMPTRGELIASGRDEAEICREIGADGLIYQDLHDLKAAVRAVNPAISRFETSCFDGIYVTGDITAEYLDGVENRRGEGKSVAAGDEADGGEDADAGQLDLNLATGRND